MREEMIENQTLFIKELDDFGQKYLKRTDEYKMVGFTKDYSFLQSKISELLLFHDKISFKVIGENIPLTLLISWYGVDGVLDLIKQDSIAFFLWNQFIIYSRKDQEGPGITSGVFKDAVFNKPIISAKNSFKFINSDERPSNSIKKKIVKKVKKITKVPSKDLAQNNLEMAQFAYFNEFGKEYNPKTVLSLEDKNKLMYGALIGMELAIASKQDYSFWNANNKWNILDKRLKLYQDKNIICQKANKILEIEGIPDISTLVAKNVIPSQDIPQIRQSNDSIKFRNWIKSQSSKTDTLSVSQEYMKSLKSKYGFTGVRWFKPLRMASFSVAGGVIGATMTGGDPVTGIISGIAADALLSTIDQYILEGMITGWKPQNFIDHNIRPYLK